MPTRMHSNFQTCMHMHVQVLWHTATAFSEVLVQAVGRPAAELSKQAAEMAADRHEHVIPVPTQSEPVAGANVFSGQCIWAFA